VTARGFPPPWAVERFGRSNRKHSARRFWRYQSQMIDEMLADINGTALPPSDDFCKTSLTLQHGAYPPP